MTLHARYLWIMFIPVLAYMGTDLLFYSLANPGPPTPGYSFDSTAPILEAGNRIRFLTAVCLFLALSILTLGVFLAELFRPGHYSRETRTRVLGTAAAAVVLSTLYGMVTTVTLDQRLYVFLAADLYPAVFNVCATASGVEIEGARCVLGIGRGEGEVPSGFDFALWLGAVAAIISVVSAAAGAILSLCQTEEQLDTERLFRLPRLFLYLSSASFTVGMISLLAWINMVIPFIAEADLEAFTVLRDAAALYLGLSYSLMILAFYAPVTLILMLRAEAYHRAHPEVERGEGQRGILPVVQRILAFLAPLLTAQISASGSALFDRLAMAAG